MRAIIGLVGLKGSGKSAAFRFIQELAPLRMPVTEMKFAGLLKEACSIASGLSIDYFEDAVLKEAQLNKPIKFDLEACNKILKVFNLEPRMENISMMFSTPRKMMQIVGTEILRAQNPLIHIEKMLENMPDEGLVVVTDLRFINEFNALQNKFGEDFYPFYVERPKAEMNSIGNHASETQPKKLRDRCLTLDNSRGLPELRDQVSNLLSNVLVKAKRRSNA